MDFDPTPYNIPNSIAIWARQFGILAAIVLVLSLLLAFARGGESGGRMFANGFLSYWRDFFSISPRRILAVVGLTLKEAWRRKALLVFVVFAVLLMFGGWFLTDSNDREDLQVSVHIPFMLTTITWLILPVTIFLSCWGIPEDIRVRSLHTVVTKPVRRIEVVMGRMLGFVAMGMTMLVLMGVIGFFWIGRQVPANVKDQFLKCRVPVYGALYFYNNLGTPRTSGINVGDAWMYRSFVTGDTRSRAIWLFPNVTPERFGDKLKFESRFEAFRTVKGSKESIQQGMEAQYTLVRNIREDAFASLTEAAAFREFAESLRAGEFVQAADQLREMSERMVSSPGDFSKADCNAFSAGVSQFTVNIFRFLQMEEMYTGFVRLNNAAMDVVDADIAENYQKMSEAAVELADLLEQNAALLFEKMPRIEVPLPPFNVTEYHDGADEIVYDRKQTYIADYEGTARFLATTISRLNEEGKLISGDGLADGLTESLEAAGISLLNAELVVEVLQGQIDEGNIQIADDKASAKDQTWLQLIYGLVKSEELVSQDADGWQLTADIYEDIVREGVLRVEVSCIGDQFYLGMARPDLFLRLPDRPFWVGFGKALLTIALMLGMITIIGVTASCVVKGPVAFFFTLTVFIIGQFFHPMMNRILMTEGEGLGLTESAVMIAQHKNPSSGIDVSETTKKVVQSIDKAVATGLIGTATNIIPDFGQFGKAAVYLGNGFDVPVNSGILPPLMTFLGFLLPCILIATACLKFRELEAK